MMKGYFEIYVDNLASENEMGVMIWMVWQKKTEVSRVDVENGDDRDRMQWDNQWEFLLSCISMSVGLGNVWRFPFTAYENGGGAFLIPYLFVLIFIGRPIYFLELCLGQFSSYSQVKVWKWWVS